MITRTISIITIIKMSLASQYKTAACGDDQKHHIPGARGRLVHRGWMLRPHKRTHKRRLRQEAPVRSVCFLFAPGGSVTVTGPHSGSFSSHRRSPQICGPLGTRTPHPAILPTESPLRKKSKGYCMGLADTTLSSPRSRPPHLTSPPPVPFFCFWQGEAGGRRSPTLLPPSPR